ncbi:hypothetical protein ARMGADRAFT_1030402 [Armillaria gallica]|uniref:Uncharacterized protein n=1 Tax=Armillaria gallica TaxID=47427 RepID=A0A2H3DPZ2_ARMGA|nr:hypothetical protein ARMGADRAFT_1030402 [Armillaria gallica]
MPPARSAYPKPPSVRIHPNRISDPAHVSVLHHPVCIDLPQQRSLVGTDNIITAAVCYTNTNSMRFVDFRVATAQAAIVGAGFSAFADGSDDASYPAVLPRNLLVSRDLTNLRQGSDTSYITNLLSEDLPDSLPASFSDLLRELILFYSSVELVQDQIFFIIESRLLIAFVMNRTLLHPYLVNQTRIFTRTLLRLSGDYRKRDGEKPQEANRKD